MPIQLTHHAVVFCNTSDRNTESLSVFLRTHYGIEVGRDPDMQLVRRTVFTIHDARALKARASQSPFGSRQVFIVECEQMLTEAQNALLKILEEPPQGTHFILIIPDLEQLLPTVRSRLHYGGTIDLMEPGSDNSEAFLELSIAQRLAGIKKILDMDDKHQARKEARIFIDALSRSLARDTVGQARALRELLEARRYVSDPSSSLKMILEHLAIVL